MNRTQEDDLTTKQAILIGVVVMTIAVLMSLCQGLKERALFDEYSKENSCTWQATGTVYGDNRDYICK